MKFVMDNADLALLINRLFLLMVQKVIDHLVFLGRYSIFLTSLVNLYATDFDGHKHHFRFSLSFIGH